MTWNPHKGKGMKRHHWITSALALALAGGAAATATPPAARAAGTLVYDISNPAFIPAYETCGHIARYGYSSVSVDWAVNGVVVAQDEIAINHTNDGSPYTLSIGQVSGGTFSAYHSETFYPSDELGPACRSM